MVKKILIALAVIIVIFLILVFAIPSTENQPVSREIVDQYMSDQAYTEHPLLSQYCKEKKIVFEKPIQAKVGQDEVVANFEEREKLLAMSLDELEANLDEATGVQQVGDLLYVIGLKHAQNSDFREMFQYWACSAENFGNTTSMLKLAKIYFHGKEEIPITPDKNRAYFWILNAIYRDALEGHINNIIANGLGLMDALQNVDSHVTDDGLDRNKVESDASSFIKLSYPEAEEF